MYLLNYDVWCGGLNLKSHSNATKSVILWCIINPLHSMCAIVHPRANTRTIGLMCVKICLMLGAVKPPTLNGVSDKTPRKFSDLLLSEPSDEQGNDSFEMLKFGLLAVVVDFRLSYRFHLPWFTRWSFFWYHQFTDRCT